MRNLQIIKNSKYFVGVSVIFVILSIVAIAVFGLKLGTDFTGGSILVVEFKDIERPSIDQINQVLEELQIEQAQIQPMGNNQYSIKMPSITEEKHQQILSKLAEKFSTGDDSQTQTIQATTQDGQIIDIPVNIGTVNTNIVEQKFDSIGPIIGKELKNKSLLATILALIAIALYIAYVFRHVSMPVESWKYGLVSLMALAHDIIIIIGVFAVLGKFLNVEIDALFITAILTTLGYSINNTIVTFDRIRENLHKKTNLTFKELVNVSINETIPRSFNTSFTTFIVLAAIFFLGGATVKFFTLALMLGIIAGTYSSVFVASPILVMFYDLKFKKRA
ncbi:MAG TPA: protein translocase subunit SecF [bacterium]|jgi:preprotein translocase subunit SecF|nr:protein translocase subunit SecF [bacterium]HOG38441.1 protein translocase subunit SecF [bacterium]